MDFSSIAAQFSWSVLGTIMIANILLSGDNAVVIAMAAKELPENQRNKAILWGSAAAIVMRVVLTLFAGSLLSLPYLKLIGGLALLYIAVDLLVNSDDEDQHKPVHTMKEAIKTILIADLVMSLDNVIAVAAAAQGNTVMLIIGLLLSIPLIIGGSTLLMKVMDKLPIIVVVGAAMLGWLAGEMFCTDPAVHHQVGELAHSTELAIKVICTALVIAIAWWRNGRELKLFASPENQ